MEARPDISSALASNHSLANLQVATSGTAPELQELSYSQVNWSATKPDEPWPVNLAEDLRMLKLASKISKQQLAALCKHKSWSLDRIERQMTDRQACAALKIKSSSFKTLERKEELDAQGERLLISSCSRETCKLS